MGLVRAMISCSRRSCEPRVADPYSEAIDFYFVDLINSKRTESQAVVPVFLTCSSSVPFLVTESHTEGFMDVAKTWF